MLTITVTGDFSLPLQRLSAQLGNVAPVLADIGYLLETNARNRAALAVDPQGQPWAPWKPSTLAGYPFAGSAAGKGKDGAGNGLLLNRYGEMLRGLNYQLEGGDAVRVGFDEDYAMFHEWGTHQMPRRGLLMADPDAGTLGAEDDAAVLDLINGWLDQAAG